MTSTKYFTSASTNDYILPYKRKTAFVKHSYSIPEKEIIMMNKKKKSIFKLNIDYKEEARLPHVYPYYYYKQPC